MLTREEILNEPAGRKLDALIAEKVMGLPKPFVSSFNGEWVIKHEEKWKQVERLENYSTDISAAWEVEEKIIASTPTVKAAYVRELMNVAGPYVETLKMIHATAEQRCKAALLAVIES